MKECGVGRSTSPKHGEPFHLAASAVEEKRQAPVNGKRKWFLLEWEESMTAVILNPSNQVSVYTKSISFYV